MTNDAPLPEPDLPEVTLDGPGLDADGSDADALAADARPQRPAFLDNRLPKPSRTIDRWGMNPEDRARVMEQCLLLERSGWKMNFAIMMLMASVVAIMGLAANSAAVVIGAMLIAPLMTPVLGIAASIAMALGNALVRSLVTVTLASVGAIALGFVAGALLPDGRPVLSAEILARTQPDIKDLFVALAAGIAGSYATARPDVSSSLPGVAIAVALVPPLCVVGLTLEVGAGDKALGALLLYITNLAAIVFMSSIVFVATGFVPGRRLLRTSPRVALGAFAALALLIFVGWRLTQATIEVNDRVALENQVSAEVATWLEGTGGQLEGEPNIDGQQVAIEVQSLNAPPPADSLVQALQPVLGEEVSVSVLWSPVQAGLLSEPIAVDEVQSAINEWIDASPDGQLYEVQALQVSNESIQVGISTDGPPPEGNELQTLLQERFEVETLVAFSEMRSLVDENSEQVARERLQTTVEVWASENGVSVSGLDLAYDGERFTDVAVTVTGAEAPSLASLDAALSDEPDVASAAQLFFTEQVRITDIPTPAPTPTPTPQPLPTPTPQPPQNTVDLVFPGSDAEQEPTPESTSDTTPEESDG